MDQPLPPSSVSSRGRAQVDCLALALAVTSSRAGALRGGQSARRRYARYSRAPV